MKGSSSRGGRGEAQTPQHPRWSWVLLWRLRKEHWVLGGFNGAAGLVWGAAAEMGSPCCCLGLPEDARCFFTDIASPSLCFPR